MGNVVLYIATSLDGFIARPDGNLDWLVSTPPPNEGDYGYKALLESVEAIIMGKETYKEVLSFGEWVYPDYDTFVLSRDISFLPTTPRTKAVHNNLPAFVGELKEKTAKNIWLVGGGQIITEFLRYDLIDKMILTIVPCILGEGIRLFPNKPKESIWTLTKVESFNTGLVNLTYKKATDL